MKINDEIKKSNPFKVPEGYFDTLTERTMSAIRQSRGEEDSALGTRFSGEAGAAKETRFSGEADGNLRKCNKVACSWLLVAGWYMLHQD